MSGILVVIIFVVVLGAIALFVVSQFNRLRRLDVRLSCLSTRRYPHRRQP